MKEKKFTLKTVEGSWRVLAVFLALILLFSILACALITRGYKIGVSDVNLDVRGADLSMELYKPVEVDSSYKLPCVVIVHGGSENLSATSLVSWEFAKRGFVVIAVSMYGAGLSGQPAISEEGRTPENYDRVGTQGVYDALQYARSLAYVDKERIGLWGHSAGYSATSDTLILDGESYTMNDRMLNVLYNQFGIEISEEQLMQDADKIAAAELNAEELAIYEYMKTEQQAIYDSYVKSARFIEWNFDIPVEVAGHMVPRDPQVNMMIGEGTHESDGIAYNSYLIGTQEDFRHGFRTGDEALVRNGWYRIDDYTMDPNAGSTLLGEMFTTNIFNSPELREAIENRNLRFFLSPETFHNGMLWDYRGISATLEYFTQTLGWNNGDLDDSATQPIDVHNFTSGYAALTCTFLALVALIGAVVALASIILKSKFFAECAVATYEPRLSTKDKQFWIATCFAVIAGFVGAWFSSEENISFVWSNGTPMKWLPWEPGQMRTIMMVGGTALTALVLFGVFALITRKKEDNTFPTLAEMNFKFGWKPVFKSLLLSAILFAGCYIAAAFIKHAFHTRFLFADGSFELMKPYGFMRTAKYALVLLPFTIIISILNNRISIKNVSDSADTALNVLVTSFGGELVLLIAIVFTYWGTAHPVVFHLHSILSLIVLIPICNYLYRKLYKLTGSIWAGAFFVAIFIGWRLSSYVSHQFIYWGPNELKAFWGIY